MSVHDVRAAMQQSKSSAGNRMFWGLLALFLAPPLAYGGWRVAVSLLTAVETTDEERAREKSTFRASDVKTKAEPNILANWLRFNRGKKDGDSAEDFVYANCMMVAAYVKGARAAGSDPFKGVQDTLDGGKLSAELKRKAEREKAMTPEQRKAERARDLKKAKASCREQSKGYKWVKN